MKKSRILIIAIIFFLTTKSHSQNPKNLDSLFAILKSNNADSSKALTLGNIAHEFYRSNPDTALYYADKAIALSKTIGFNKGLTAALNNKGYALGVLNDLNGEELLHRKALEISEKMHLKDEMARSYLGLGNLNITKGNFLIATEYYEKALRLSLETDNKRATASSYTNLTSSYGAMGNFPKALEYQFKGIKILEELKNYQLLGSAYNNVGAIFRNMEKYNDAIKYYEMALVNSEKANNKSAMARTHCNIGEIYFLTFRYEESEKAFLKSIEVAKESNLAVYLARSYHGIGLIYSKKHDYGNALHHLITGYKLAEKINSTIDLPGMGVAVGWAYINSGKPAEAFSYLIKNLETEKQKENNTQLYSIYECLHAAYAGVHDYKNAYKYQTEFMIVKDTIYSNENARALEEINAKYETEKKDQKIVLLNKDKLLNMAELKRQNTIKNFTAAGSGALVLFSLITFVFYKRKRDSDNKQKEALFNSQVSDMEMKALRAQMNPHFIFNSLRSINEYIQHNKSTLASEYLIKFSKLMRAILENSRQKEVVLSKEIEVLELYMQLESQRMEYPFVYSIEIDPEIDVENTLIPPMLLQPVVENSIWHGLAPKENEGKINIRIKKQNNTIRCEVEDDGIGREVSNSLNKESKTESYGLKITEERLNIISQTTKLNTILTFHDVIANNNIAGLKVTFLLPFEKAI